MALILIFLLVAWLVLGSLQEIASWLFWLVVIILLIGVLSEGIKWIRSNRT